MAKAMMPPIRKRRRKSSNVEGEGSMSSKMLIRLGRRREMGRKDQMKKGPSGPCGEWVACVRWPRLTVRILATQ